MKMIDLEKREQIIMLYDEYKKLLTVKQQEYFEMYYFEDYSLSEIASFCNVSRNAIFDQLKKTISNLEHYESCLHNIAKKNKIRNLKECNIDVIIKILEE